LKEESLDNTVSTIKSGLSTKKTQKPALKNSNNKDSSKDKKGDDSPTITSQVTSILQLTEQVNKIKQTNKMFLTRFDQLAEQMAALLAANNNNSSSQCLARGHSHHESSTAT